MKYKVLKDLPPTILKKGHIIDKEMGFLCPDFRILATWLALGWIEEVKEDGEGWLPNVGDEYWRPFAEYNIVEHTARDTWKDDTLDHIRRNSLGVYRTKEEAQRAGEIAQEAVRKEISG